MPTYCEASANLGNGMVCIKPNCDGFHHHFVPVNEPLSEGNRMPLMTMEKEITTADIVDRYPPEGRF